MYRHLKQTSKLKSTTNLLVPYPARGLHAQFQPLTHLRAQSLGIHSPRLGLSLLTTVFSRRVSTAQNAAGDARSVVTRFKNFFLGSTIGVFIAFTYYYTTDTRAGIHQWVVAPSLRWIYDDAEDAHEAGVKALRGLYKLGIHPRERGNVDGSGDLNVEVFGHTLLNPVGTSAGIDKHADVPSPLLALGPAIIEIGGTTPYPQDGNEKPRVFRLPSQKALINRYGLNSEGADHVAMRLRQRVREFAYSKGFGIDEAAELKVLDGESGVPPGSLTEGKLMAVQIAKNKFTPDDDIEAVKNDYVYCVQALARYADIIVVNVSSPNSPGLRGLQKVEPLTKILTEVVKAAKETDRKSKPAVMVKVSPDEDSDEQVSGVCEAVWESGVDGVIVGNTTKRRPDPLPSGGIMPEREVKLLLEQGGYSGPQLFGRTVDLVRKYRKILDYGPLPEARSSPQAPPSAEIVKPTSPSTSRDNEGVDVAQRIEATVDRDRAHLKHPSGDVRDSDSQPLIRFPERHNPSSKSPNSSGSPALSSSTHLVQLPQRNDLRPAMSEREDTEVAGAGQGQPKIIFATGGITSGKQALEVLNAGASVAMVYTALVYGGLGTISRVKQEMRDEIKRTAREDE
ncbi:Dihydroorotate dehydrogenase (quinone), mitochondrial [Loxospora ochrophaea]|nr:Dihydroorotate dehydrogenase (quinone), mitochondrial [Loxospora ochrophaea]